MKNIQLSFCHRLPERSFFWKGKQFPVCARCTGIHLGYLSMPIFFFDFAYMTVGMSILLILPTSIDGLIQAIWKVESKNWRRLSTGIMAGIGIMSLISIVGNTIGEFILTIIKN